MSSAYAPLPFSYLSADGPKPRPGMRKDGVYGTSADVPRIYEEPDPSQRDAGSGTGFVNNPYNVYSNAQQVRLDNYEAVYRPSQMPQAPAVALTPRTAQESPYDVRQRPDLLEGRAQNPHGGGEYHVYSIPEADYVTSDKDLRQREDRKPGYGIRQPELSTPKQERIQSYYPPDIDKYPRGQNEMISPTANDNFILVKDPNRTDPKPVSDAAALNRDAGKTKLQTLFEDSGPTPMPRHNNHNNPSHELGYEEPNHSSSYGLNAAESPMGNGKGPKEMTSNEHRAKTAYAEKGSKGKQCCHCSKCTAVILAIIITAVICLGVGFVAGWFGAMADRDKNAANSTSQPAAAFNEQTTNTTTASSSLATTKESTSTTKTSPTSAHQSSSTTTTTASTTTTTTTAHSFASSEASSATSNATTKSVSAPTG